MFLWSRWLCGWAMPPWHHGEQTWDGSKLMQTLTPPKGVNISNKNGKRKSSAHRNPIRHFQQITDEVTHNAKRSHSSPLSMKIMFKRTLLKSTSIFQGNPVSFESELVSLCGREKLVLPDLLKARRDFDLTYPVGQCDAKNIQPEFQMNWKGFFLIDKHDIFIYVLLCHSDSKLYWKHGISSEYL